MRRTIVPHVRKFNPSFLTDIARYDEDRRNDYDWDRIVNTGVMRNWYKKVESGRARRLMLTARNYQSVNHHRGDHWSGQTVFERELERKGVPIEKYPLPSTAGATRLKEMTLLRRKQLEDKSSHAMEEARAKGRREVPSAWYDEADGPLNPHYLQFVRAHYSAVDVTELPETPIRYSQLMEGRQLAAGSSSSSDAAADRRR